MNKSESIKNLASALSKFQAEIQNPKNTADNPFFKSKYAPLQDVLNIARPLLARHGLSVLQMPGGNGEHIGITTMLMHDSGEWIESEPLVLKAEKVTAQGAGSAITYGRRYSLSAFLGISSEDDDDGNHASKGKNEKPETPKAVTSVPKAPLPELPTDQVTYITDLLQQKGITELFHANMMKKINVTETKYLTQEQYDKYIAYLEKQPDKEEKASA